jgi:hypothetical protein
MLIWVNTTSGWGSFPLNAIGEETITQNTTALMQETAIG